MSGRILPVPPDEPEPHRRVAALRRAHDLRWLQFAASRAVPTPVAGAPIPYEYDLTINRVDLTLYANPHYDEVLPFVLGVAAARGGAADIAQIAYRDDLLSGWKFHG